MGGRQVATGSLVAALMVTLAVDLTAATRSAAVAVSAPARTAHAAATRAEPERVLRLRARAVFVRTSASVATVWLRPGLARHVDRKALAAHPDLRGWLRDQTLAQRRDLVGRVLTQSLRGDRLQVLGHRRGWTRVRLPEQRGSYFRHGIVGWVPSRQLASSSSHAASPRAVVRRSGPGAAAVVMRVARSFLGAPYVWGGMSAAGMDCSGLTYRAYYAVGITLPRDAADQARLGRPVRRKALRPGDLVFFGPASSRSIHHVGVYAGHGLVLHAPHTGTRVRLTRLSAWPDYWGARRYV